MSRMISLGACAAMFWNVVVSFTDAAWLVAMAVAPLLGGWMSVRAGKQERMKTATEEIGGEVT